MKVGQGYIVLVVGAGGGYLEIYSLVYHNDLDQFCALDVLKTARYRLKYCLKGPLNPKQSTNCALPQARFFDSLRNRIFMSENFICT